MKLFLRSLLCAALAGMLAGCATQSSLEIVRNDVDTVKSRLLAAEKEVGTLRDETKSSITALEAGLKTDLGSSRRISADIQATIDSTKSEMAALSGRIDDMSLASQKPADEFKRYRDDADKRIVALEDRILKLQSTVDDLNKKLAESAQPKKKEEPITPESLYNKALELFKAGDMPAARSQLTKFIEQNPQHDLAANAQYWIGETHYTEKSYEPAILAYQEVIKTYPGKEKVPAAMLKQAMAFKAIKDTRSASYILKKLVEGFPKAEESKRAKELLKEIK